MCVTLLDQQGPAIKCIVFSFSIILRGSFHRRWEHRLAWLWLSLKLWAACEGWDWVKEKASFLCVCLNVQQASAMNMPVCIFCAHAVIACDWRRGLVFFFCCCFLLWYMCAEQGRERVLAERGTHVSDVRERRKLSRNISERCIILYHRGGTALLLIQSLWKKYIYNCIY